VGKIVKSLRILVSVRKNNRIKYTRTRFFRQAIDIYKKKIKDKHPIFTARKRSKVFGSGPSDLKN